MTQPATRLVSRTTVPPPQQEPVGLPIYQSTTFVIDDALTAAMAQGDYRTHYLYSRMGNPTVRALEQRLAELHGAEEAVAFASGMGAVSAALIGLTEPGDGVVGAAQLYGVSAAFLTRYLAPMGRPVAFADVLDPAAVDAALAQLERPRWLVVETLSNPLLAVAPVSELAQVAARHGARLLVDNTFANPLVCRPLSLGAAVVVESLSKSIAGHSDVHGGLVAGNGADVAQVWDAMIHLGSCLDPHAAALIWRGLKTLALRTQASARTATELAHRLVQHPRVASVAHPSLATGPAAARVAQVLTGPGSMLTFALRGDDAAAAALLTRLRVALPATSLGGVETLASCPFNTSHRTPEARERVGLQPGTVRLSVGLEDVEDLWADLAQALDG